MASDIYSQNASHPDRFRAEGYAWGILDQGSEWLSILGSHWESIPLPESPDDTVRPGVTVLRGGEPKPYTLAKVRRDGQDIFRVLEVVRTYTPARS
ncbi:hypothetical protein K388_07468 [Streptomyces sp. KhCrAH-43]|uniref:hypothetical protein n=1 Tax=unclassified Streptomyces TaxID=2593676 RepID=UPI000371ECC1|nr:MULTISPECIES: hypothetical protein [unclassified Streptomyces]MYS35958.1 hypothetical protein [Streptomyces sp. SID4920]MYX70941.1 hypothetical protein [Streptomyces sp. SID8373]RAJ42596.1 hypothetical protein K388_07468 [Streptomyces sp. KhCrAH-43]